jgi:hypothetical protein
MDRNTRIRHILVWYFMGVAAFAIAMFHPQVAYPNAAAVLMFFIAIAAGLRAGWHWAQLRRGR